MRIGQKVLWHSAKGYTPPPGEIGIIDEIFPVRQFARLTLDLTAEESAANPEFGGKCSVCMPLAELTVIE